MGDTPRQRGPIALYGATGFTGKLTAAELAAAGAEFVISGRNRKKLEALAGELDAQVSVKPASLDEPDELRDLLYGCEAVIDCAGPFSRYGEPVLRAAVETGTHYLDSTGEQAYMRMAFERYGAEAEKAGVAVIPAMGFDYVPGDMIASLTAEGMGELDEILLAYAALGFEATRGTTLTALEAMRGGDFEFRDREWRTAPQSFSRGSFDFGEPIGSQPMIRYPAGEQVTVPQHVPTRSVRTILTAVTAAPSRRFARAVPLIARPLGLAMRTPIRRMFEAGISRMPEGPSEEGRGRATWKIVCEARSGSRVRRGTVSGGDPYGLTAAALTRGALIAAGRGFDGRGPLAPSQAFDCEDFLASLERFDVRWQVEAPAAEPVAVAG